MSVIEGEALIAEAAETLRNQARDFYKLKITLPLGDKNLKYVHTNQFLWLDFPKDTFTLANWKYIAEALDGYETQHSGYVKNRWYIESCTITNDGNSAKMELELNPFASSTVSLTKDYESFTDAYDQAYNKNNENSNGDDVNSIPSVAGNNTSLTGGEPKVINDQVAKIVKNKTDPYEKAKLIHAWLRNDKNLDYHRYDCKKWSTPLKCWNHKTSPGLNCADTAQLTASMFRSAGIKCFVAHDKSHHHFYTVFYDAQGKMHCSDTTGNRGLDKYWQCKGCSDLTFHGKLPRGTYNEGNSPNCTHRNYS